MIKKILIGVIFLVLTGIGVLDIIFVNNAITKAIDGTNQLEVLIVRGASEKEVQEKAAEIEQNWVKNEKILTIFMYDRDIDTLGKQINLVRSLIDGGSIDEAKVEIGGLKYLLSSAKKVSEFNFDNIL